jgi:FlaA1/EpsC-like NDP-sugar epimerase
MREMRERGGEATPNPSYLTDRTPTTTMSTTTTLPFTLPPHVRTILITGAGGYVGQRLTRLILAAFPHVSLITTDVRPPPTFGVHDENRLISVAADLGNKDDLARLFEGRRVQGVFALQCVACFLSQSYLFFVHPL